ncbi:cytochrome P450 [Brachybacterium huguangmaarense]|uniref:Cytochrome P450 n=1 Tax=Brachybacterium huguangmaarense TaxID=1652028 RepID=A0ABY6FZL0_9MICO|nr:cytochrome P450 [Brachybacterium huguangmaarense]UYG15826.1 cytochrome P450 [Brachybacterium huguangmaarense]
MSGVDRRRSHRPGEATGPRLEHDGRRWRIRSLAAARQVLRARGATTQAGFTAEAIPTAFLRHHPILLSDGPGHDDQRRAVGRFLAPAVVEERWAPVMAASADELVGATLEAGTCRLDQLALHFSVDVARRIVGLTEAPLEAMSARLVTFMRQPPFDLAAPHWGRTRRQWASAGLNALVPLVRFHVRDVRPALRARRRARRDDIISHLLDSGYGEADILVECVTYATAGMITTREFIAMACWHLLADDALRERYRTAGRTERLAILAEIIRLEPVVGHLHRRVREDLEVDDREARAAMRPGELADLCIRDANADPEAVGPDPLDLCPGRPMPPGVGATGLSFGAGAHRCPGEHLALAETDVLLTRLLACDVRLDGEPRLGWVDLVEGYTVRDMRLVLGPRPTRDGAVERP